MSETANIEITASSGRLPAALRAATRLMDGFATRVSGVLGAAALAPAKALRTIGQVAGYGLAFRGLDVLVTQGKEVFEFNRELTRLGIDTRKVPGEMDGIGKAIRQISTETGVSAINVLKAGRAYVDLAGAESFTVDKMRLVAQAAQSSGAEVKDMAELLFTLTENMKVPPGELEGTLSGLINQAKDGSIHFRELAHELIALGPVYSQYGIQGRQGAIQLGAMMQVARRGFGSASEAATGVLRILRSIPQHASKFRKFGIEVFAPGSKNNLDHFLNIIQKIKSSGLSLNREQLIKAFGRTEGERFYQLLVNTTEQFDKLLSAGGDSGTMMKDLFTFLETPTGRMDKALEKMRNTLADAFTPERIDKFTSAIEALADKIEPVAKAVGAIGDVLGKVYAAGKGLREMVSDPDAANPWGAMGSSKAEQKVDDAINADRLDSVLRNRGINSHRFENAIEPGIRKSAELAKFNRAFYNTTLRDLVTAQGGVEAAPNDAAIAEALRAAAADPNKPGGLGRQLAGKGYLEGAHIPQAKIDQVKEAEFNRQIAPAMERLGASIGASIADALGKNKPPTAREQAIAIRDALDEAKGMVVEINGNPVAKAGAAATDRRRK